MRILITGGQSLIGQAIGQHRKALGDQVILTSSRAEGMQKLGGDFEVFQFDLKNPLACEAALDELLKKGLDGVILNAASESPRLAQFDKLEWNEIQDFLNANVNGNIWLLQKLLPHFKNQKFGRVVFMSSMLTESPLQGYSVYAAAKSSLETVVKYIAMEYGEFNITANTVRLGIFKTERNKAFWRRDSIREKMESRISLKRLGSPENILPLMDALLDKDSYIQGSAVEVCGGLFTPTQSRDA
jgi:NAD(P)-dependent dehydrogenase (short-subunit alcohol dehydrogenase family)